MCRLSPVKIVRFLTAPPLLEGHRPPEPCGADDSRLARDFGWRGTSAHIVVRIPRQSRPLRRTELIRLPVWSKWVAPNATECTPGHPYMWHSVPGRVRAICACCELPAQANLGGQDLRRAQDRARWITGGCNRKLTQGRQAQIRNTSARNLRLAVCYPLATATPILPWPRARRRAGQHLRPARAAPPASTD